MTLATQHENFTSNIFYHLAKYNLPNDLHILVFDNNILNVCRGHPNSICPPNQKRCSTQRGFQHQLKMCKYSENIDNSNRNCRKLYTTIFLFIPSFPSGDATSQFDVCFLYCCQLLCERHNNYKSCFNWR